jgi:hypothetical protein
MPDDDELEFVHKLQQMNNDYLSDFYLELISGFSTPLLKDRRMAIELTKRELELRSTLAKRLDPNCPSRVGRTLSHFSNSRTQNKRI